MDARRVQVLADRAGKRWARRFAARLDAEKRERRCIPQLRDLERQADFTFRSLLKLDGPDPMAAQLRRAQDVQDAKPNPDDPDDYDAPVGAGEDVEAFRG